MAGAVYEVIGGRELRRTLKAAGDDLSELKAIHRAAAEVAANRIRAKAPSVTGKLKATIRAAGTKTAGIVRIGNNTKVRYANPIHFGWYRRHITANPFASDGARESESAWIGLYATYIDNTLTKIKGA